MRWKRGDIAIVQDSFSGTDSVYTLPRKTTDDSIEIPKGSPVLILDPYSEEGFETYGDHSGEKWMLVLWEGKEWFVYASDLRAIKNVEGGSRKKTGAPVQLHENVLHQDHEEDECGK